MFKLFTLIMVLTVVICFAMDVSYGGATATTLFKDFKFSTVTGPYGSKGFKAVAAAPLSFGTPVEFETTDTTENVIMVKPCTASSEVVIGVAASAAVTAEVVTIVNYGVASVLIVNQDTIEVKDWVCTSGTAGRVVDKTRSSTLEAQSIGYALETVSAGTDETVLIFLDFD